MKPYLALTRVNLRLAAREKAVLFFNYVFPLIFFFAFGQMFHAERGGAINQVVTITLVIGVLGSGLFGAGIRAVQEREMNILRRFKVAPITPAPILLASMTTGLTLYLPSVVLIFALAHFVYGMPVPERWFSLLLLISLGLLAFRSLGLIIASVVNSAQESQILIQLFYMPMLLLSGATFPLTIMPRWAQTIAEFLPAAYLFTGVQGMIFRREDLAGNASSVLGLVITAVLATFISFKLFRWEKEEKIPAPAKLWLIAVLVPFIVLGFSEVKSRQHITKAKLMNREMGRTQTILIRNAAIFIGDGQMIESGGVLLKNGKVEQVFEGPTPDSASLKAHIVEAAGKTVLPGLIDTNVHVTAAGGFPGAMAGKDPEKLAQRNLAAYLYCGVTSVKSVDDPLDVVSRVRAQNQAGERLGADLYLPVAAPALKAYDPALCSVEAFRSFLEGKTELLNRSLVQQVVTPELLKETLNAMRSGKRFRDSPATMEEAVENLRRAYQAGMLLVTGTDAGKFVFHGPTVHREMKLWVDAGIPAKIALQGATYNAARALRAEDHIGLIRKGYDADLLLVDGNPLQDITMTERISSVYFKGERVSRSELFDEKN